jgi:hypothetical protein
MQSKAFRDRISKKMNARIYQALSVALTFFVISLCFVFFRAESLQQVGVIFRQLVHFNLEQDLGYFRMKNISMILGLFFLLFIFIKWDQSIADQIRDLKAKGSRMMVIASLLLVVLMMGMVLGKEQFIYFQF